MAEQEKCVECGRPFASSYASWQCSDTTCGLSPAWNEEGEKHDDCINECIYATKKRLESELALARKALAAAEEMRRKAASSKNRAAMAAIEAFDAAMAEVRRVGGG